MALRIALTHLFAWPEVRRGGERYLHELASALSDAGHDVAVLTTSPTRHRERVLGVEVTYLPRRRLMPSRFGPLSSEVAFAAQSMGHLAWRPLDVWHALGAADASAAACLGSVRSVRSVYTCLGIPARRSWDKRPDRRLHDLAVDRCDHYVCLSESAGSFLRRDYGREPVVIGGGVDVRRFRPPPERHPSPVLLFAGSVNEPRKNLPLLLEAVTLLRRRGMRVQLWISGPGDRSRVRALAGENGLDGGDWIVDRGLGSPEQLAELYGRAWATVLPADLEAFGLVLVESLACGTPIVTLEGGGPAEIVREGIGLTCRPTAESLAEACAGALELALDPGTTAACRSAAAGYDWRTGIVPRLEALYHHLA